MPSAPDLDALRAEALAAVDRYAAAAFEDEPFVPGESSVSVAGKVIGAPELRTLVDAALDGWLTEGRFADEFRGRLAGITERPNVALVGSGSQANLLA
ncbi:MAG: CDP-4-dehydro-6-deoxyglucose reductase, partial [Solirubrobacteraceae bacterium]|nr:CDP-4-dehydro-6-deoxyglucose reductase [Solirubrobacteraceae bacterium]